jgi:hypothetical protein
MKDYLIWVKHGEGSSAPSAEANPVHANGLNMDNGTRHHRPQTDPIMANLSDDDDVSVQNMCEDVDQVQVVDESEQAEFFEALLHCYSDPSMFLIKGMEASKKAATEHLYKKSKGCTDEFTTLRAVLQFLMLKSQYSWSDASFNEFLRVLAKRLPNGNKVSANTYYAKKLINPLTMAIEKIDMCRNHCILY